jgi:putative ABC transport system ATP-binding protein
MSRERPEKRLDFWFMPGPVEFFVQGFFLSFLAFWLQPKVNLFTWPMILLGVLAAIVSSAAAAFISTTLADSVRDFSAGSREGITTPKEAYSDQYVRPYSEYVPLQEPLIQMSGITKIFYTNEIETHALSGIHLSINKHEFVAIEGPSGCGKSTLLSIIGLLDTPTSGRYLLNGHAVENLNFAQRSRIRNEEIGFIFQSFNLIGDLTVYENVELPLTYRLGISSAERKRRVVESLERVSMAHRMRHYPSQLSGGQQQRAAVARALAGSPSILLADEPTGNLDSRNGEAVMELLYNLHQDGVSIVLVTHDPRFALFAERRIYLFDGKVLVDGSAEFERVLQI